MEMTVTLIYILCIQNEQTEDGLIISQPIYL
jgi:hypothetical protein